MIRKFAKLWDHKINKTLVGKNPKNVDNLNLFLFKPGHYFYERYFVYKLYFPTEYFMTIYQSIGSNPIGQN
jgi:hypothetical protein